MDDLIGRALTSEECAVHSRLVTSQLGCFAREEQRVRDTTGQDGLRGHTAGQDVAIGATGEWVRRPIVSGPRHDLTINCSAPLAQQPC